MYFILIGEVNSNWHFKKDYFDSMEGKSVVGISLWRLSWDAKAGNHSAARNTNLASNLVMPSTELAMHS